MRSFKKLALFPALLLAVMSFIPLAGCAGGDLPSEPTVRYSDFGAKGDGVTDDFAAIVATHEYANEHDIAVCADKNATYYIGGAQDETKIHEKSAIIKTNTYWRKAKFIIDDRGLAGKKARTVNIFSVEQDHAKEEVKLPEGYSLKAGQKKLGITFGEKKLVHIVNKNKKDFIRSGVDENKGSDRQEVLLVGKNGKIKKSTPLLWDYDTVTSMTAYSTTDRAITISGGEFLTIASEVYDGYYSRGIVVRRPNTKIKAIKHTVSDESTQGTSYNGFITVNKTTNVIIKNCGFWGRLTPIRSNGLTQGTYDITATLANNVTWKGCTQLNDLTYGWGIMGSNHCKNLNMVNCYLSRFDAHQGVCNATIKKTTLRDLSVVGFGKFYLNKVHRACVKEKDYGEAAFISLRTDYGAFWRGNIVLKNCTMDSNATVNYIIKEVWQDWDYGYQCSLPAKLTAKNVTVNYVGQNKKPSYWVYSNIDTSRTHTLESMANTNNPLVMPQKVVVKNCATDFQLTTNQTGLFDNTVFQKQPRASE